MSSTSARSRAARLLTEHTTITEVAAASGYSQRPLGNGGTSASNYLTSVLGGRDSLTPRWEAAIRRHVPAWVANEVVDLAATAFEARRA